jgi:hypothetical protein
VLNVYRFHPAILRNPHHAAALAAARAHDDDVWNGSAPPPPPYCCPYLCPYCTLPPPSLLLPLPVSLLYTHSLPP